MPETEMIVIIASFSAMLIAAVQLLRLVGTFIVHRTMRRAIELDPGSAGPLLERLETQREPRNDDRLAVVLTAVGIAMVAASLVIGDPSWIHYGIAGALFPLILGAALGLRLYVLKRASGAGAA